MLVFDAINQMRSLSKAKKSFSISFMSYSRSRQSTDGIVVVTQARLKPRTKKATYQNSEIIEEYIDLATNESRKFYHPTLMTFNGQKLELL